MMTTQDRLREWLFDAVLEFAEGLEGDEPYAEFTVRNVTDARDIECHNARVKLSDGDRTYHFVVSVMATGKD